MIVTARILCAGVLGFPTAPRLIVFRTEFLRRGLLLDYVASEIQKQFEKTAF